MAKYKNQSGRAEGRSVVDAAVDEPVENETGKLGEQREDSEGGDREDGKEEKGSEVVPAFPIKLAYPSEPVVVYEHFAKSMDEFQRAITHSKDDGLKNLTITQATLDVPVMPEIHHTPYCGFRVLRGNGFHVRLNNGQIVTAIPE